MLDQYTHTVVEWSYLPLPLDGEASNLDGSELIALSLLGRKGKGSMTELAEECSLALSSMTGVVDRLVRKDLLKRVWDNGHRKKVYVELDKKGKKIYQKLVEGEMHMIIPMKDLLTPDEQDALLDALGKAAGSARV